MKWKNNLALLPLVVATFASAQPIPADIGSELQVMRQQIQQLQQQLQQQQLQQQAQQPASPSLSLFPFTAQMPIGSVVAFAMTDLPEGWLACNGAAVSREQYAALFDQDLNHPPEGSDGWQVTEQVSHRDFASGSGLQPDHIPAAFQNEYLSASGQCGEVGEARGKKSALLLMRFIIDRITTPKYITKSQNLILDKPLTTTTFF